jgi:hypothetical protein
MNASMARRIRCAESLLIYAIDRQYGEQRNWTQAAQFQTHAIRLPVVDRNGNRASGNRNQTGDLEMKLGIRIHKCPACKRLIEIENPLCMGCFARTPEGKKINEGFEQALRIMARRDESRHDRA